MKTKYSIVKKIESDEAFQDFQENHMKEKRSLSHFKAVSKSNVNF